MNRQMDVAPTAIARAFRQIAEDIESGVAALARMIAIDTSFPPGAGYSEFISLIETFAAPLGFRTRRVIVPEPLWYVPGGHAHGERVNLIAARRTGKPVLGLYFHTDTVPPAEGWTHDPFTLTEDGDRLIGLGAADMKGSITAVHLALRAADACGVKLAYDPMLLFCTDEEGGCYPGVRYLAEQGLLEGHILNFNGTAAARIWAGCFGLFNLLIRIKGRSGHAGDTRTGLNAVEAALPIMNALTALKPSIAARRSKLPPPPEMNGALLTARLGIAAAHGGTSGGQVPSQFEILINRRYAPEEDFAAARAEIETAIRAATPAGAAIEMDLVGHLAPTTDPTGPHWPRWQAALSQGFGYKPEEFRAWGAASCSDFGWVQRATGRHEVLLTGLGRSHGNVHAPGEFTTRSDIIALAQSVLAYLAADFEPGMIPTP